MVASNGLELGNLWKPLETHGNPLEALLEPPGNPSRNPAETLPEALLITEVELAPPRLPTKSAACKEMDKTVRLLEPRCQAASFFARLQGAVQKWSDTTPLLRFRRSPRTRIAHLAPSSTWPNP